MESVSKGKVKKRVIGWRLKETAYSFLNMYRETPSSPLPLLQNQGYIFMINLRVEKIIFKVIWSWLTEKEISVSFETVGYQWSKSMYSIDKSSREVALKVA